MKANILGVQIDDLSIKEILEKIQKFLKSDNKHFIVTPNPEFIVQTQSDSEFCQILNHADIAVPDGAGIIFASKILKQPIVKRITGNDLVWRLVNLAEKDGYSIFLFGGKTDIAAKAAINIKKIFPNVAIVGAESGGKIENPKQVDASLIDQINQAEPDILLVALGHGKQEKFIYYNLDKLKTVKVAIGIGGVFDYISGNAKRAPKWLRKIGLEWLYRLVKQPKRLPRIYKATIVFLWLVIKEKLNFQNKKARG